MARDCGIPDDWPPDDPRPCPECGATVSRNDPVGGVCQGRVIGREMRRQALLIAELRTQLAAANERVRALEKENADLKPSVVAFDVRHAGAIS